MTYFKELVISFCSIYTNFAFVDIHSAAGLDEHWDAPELQFCMMRHKRFYYHKSFNAANRIK